MTNKQRFLAGMLAWLLAVLAVFAGVFLALVVYAEVVVKPQVEKAAHDLGTEISKSVDQFGKDMGDVTPPGCIQNDQPDVDCNGIADGDE